MRVICCELAMYEKLVKQRFFKILANKVSYVTVDKQVFKFGLFWERSDFICQFDANGVYYLSTVWSCTLAPIRLKLNKKCIYFNRQN